MIIGRIIQYLSFCFQLISLNMSSSEKAMSSHSSTLAWKIHGWRSLVGCSPWGSSESDTTDRLHFHFSLSRIGEGNGGSLHCSGLENPRDGGASMGSHRVGHDGSDLGAAATIFQPYILKSLGSALISCVTLGKLIL